MFSSVCYPRKKAKTPLAGVVCLLTNRGLIRVRQRGASLSWNYQHHHLCCGLPSTNTASSPVVPAGSAPSVQPNSLTTNSVLPFLKLQMACVHASVPSRDFVPA